MAKFASRFKKSSAELFDPDKELTSKFSSDVSGIMTNMKMSVFFYLAISYLIQGCM